jgi:hypothetical protein
MGKDAVIPLQFKMVRLMSPIDGSLPAGDDHGAAAVLTASKARFRICGAHIHGEHPP